MRTGSSPPGIVLEIMASLLLVSLLAAAPAAAAAEPLGEPFVNERLRIAIRPPAGWRLVRAGERGEEPIEFWQSTEYGPRIQIRSFPFSLPDDVGLDRIQTELRRALTQRFPTLDIHQERQLEHRGHPGVEVMATLAIGNTYYHVIQRCLLADERLYVITCASFENTFLSDLPLYRATLDSVELLGPVYRPGGGTGAGHLVPPKTAGFFLGGLVLVALALRTVSRRRLAAGAARPRRR